MPDIYAIRVKRNNQVQVYEIYDRIARNGHFIGDVYTNADPDYTGGNKLPDENRVNALISAAISDISGISTTVVQERPAVGEPNIIYFVPHEGDDNDIYDEFMYINNSWELIGTTQVDISSKADKADTVLDTTLSMGRDANSTVGAKSTALGNNVTASGNNSQAFGASSLADGFASHAEGASTAATGYTAHAEGSGTTSSGRFSHAEGGGASASGDGAHAEGQGTIASDTNAHAEGGATHATGQNSHAEGASTTASGYQSHAEGTYSIASGDSSHSEGSHTTASGVHSHVEGYGTIANHKSQHVSGEYNIVDPSLADATKRGTYVEIIGNGTNNNRSNARTLDWNGNEELAGDLIVNKGTANEVSVGALKGAIKRLVIPTFTRDMTSQNPNVYTCDMQWNEVEAAINNKTCNTCEVLFINSYGTSNDYLTLLGIHGEDSDCIEFESVTLYGTETRNKNIKFYDNGTVEYTYDSIDLNTKADRADTVLDTTLSRGRKRNSAVGTGSFAFGDDVRATGNYSHAEGWSTIASGEYAHAEGAGTTASYGESHAEGSGTIAGNNCAHAEGNSTIATGHAAHAEGNHTEAPGAESHSEGDHTQANGYTSHSEGEGTIANANASHVGGQYNVADGYGPEWEEWTPNKLYHVGDKVKQTFDWGAVYYICSTENSDSEFIYGHWEVDNNRMNYVEIIGNGTDDDNRSNARSLDWKGNEHLAGDVYVHANADGFGGSKLPDESRVNALIATAVGSITNFDAEVVQALPQTGVTGTIYLVPKQGSGTDVHDEYIYVNNAWELIGTTQIDVSNKADKADTVLDTTLSRGRKANATVGTASFAFGDTVEASGTNSHAEGARTIASGYQAHAEGADTSATGNESHAEGSSTNALGHQSHAEGTGGSNQIYYHYAYSSQNEQVTSVNDAAIAKSGSVGVSSHSEGTNTTTNGHSSHAEGYHTLASSNYSHAEGYLTNAIGDASHTEGNQTSTGGSYSHAEGIKAFANGNYSHAEGYQTNAIGEASHAEGSATKGHNDYYNVSYNNQTDTKSASTINGLPGAIGTVTHSEGIMTRAAGSYSHAEGCYTLANGANAHSEGSNTNANGSSSHTEGDHTVAYSNQSHAEGYYTLAQGINSHAEGDSSIAYNASSHAEGNTTKALGLYSHAEGYKTKAIGSSSHSEGELTIAEGYRSHAEGYNSTASGTYSHAEGMYGRVNSNGNGAHSEGYGSETNVTYYPYNQPVDRTENFNGRKNPGTSMSFPTGAHNQGAHNEGTFTTANATSSHAEGYSTLALATNSHAEGMWSIATGAQATHAEGMYTYASGGGGSHAEGQYTMAEGSGGEHSEGMYTYASGGGGTHAEGFATFVGGGSGSHAEGYYVYGSGSFGFHIEGDHTECNVGNGSHTEGYYSKSFGRYGSHTEGVYTIGQGEGSHTGGRYNVPNHTNFLPDWEPNKLYHVGDRVKHLYPGSESHDAYTCKTEHTSGSEFSTLNWSSIYADNGYAEIIGNGTADDARANARALDWEGNERLSGNLYVGCNPDSTGGTKVLTENDLEYTTEADALKIISDFWNEDEEDETMIVEMVATANGYASVMDASEIGAAIESGKIAMLHIPAPDSNHPDAYIMLGYYAPALEGSENYRNAAFAYVETSPVDNYSYDLINQLNYPLVNDNGKLEIYYAA